MKVTHGSLFVTLVVASVFVAPAARAGLLYEPDNYEAQDNLVR